MVKKKLNTKYKCLYIYISTNWKKYTPPFLFNYIYRTKLINMIATCTFELPVPWIRRWVWGINSGTAPTSVNSTLGLYIMKSTLPFLSDTHTWRTTKHEHVGKQSWYDSEKRWRNRPSYTGILLQFLPEENVKSSDDGMELPRNVKQHSAIQLGLHTWKTLNHKYANFTNLVVFYQHLTLLVKEPDSRRYTLVNKTETKSSDVENITAVSNKQGTGRYAL